MAAEDSSFCVIILFALVSLGSSDLERLCDGEEYTPVTKVCGVRVMEFIINRCIDTTEPAATADTEPESGIFIDVNEANELLNYRVHSGLRYGLTCECCAHRCTPSEFDQYCSPLRTGQHLSRSRRRVRRSTSRRRKSHFTKADIENLYASIHRSENDTNVVLEKKRISLSKYEQISTMKAWKLWNIERKVLTKFGLVEEVEKAEVEVNKASPPGKVTMDGSETHASKPKLFPGVNKDSPAPHHRHHHNYPTHRADVVNNRYS